MFCNFILLKCNPEFSLQESFHRLFFSIFFPQLIQGVVVPAQRSKRKVFRFLLHTSIKQGLWNQEQKMSQLLTSAQALSPIH